MANELVDQIAGSAVDSVDGSNKLDCYIIAHFVLLYSIVVASSLICMHLLRTAA